MGGAQTNSDYTVLDTSFESWNIGCFGNEYECN